MLKVSNSLPISNYSQVVISDNAGATFKPKTNSRIRVNLPANLGMVDFHSSYLQFKAKITTPANFGTENTFQVGFGNGQGIEQIVRDLVVRVDGKPVETITNYNILDKARKDYADDMTMDNKNSLFNHADLKPDNPSYFITDWNSGDLATGVASVATYNNIATKQQICPELSGILSMRQGFPIVATGAVEVEVNLEDAENCLVPLQNNKGVKTDGTEGYGLQNGTANGTGSIARFTLDVANNALEATYGITSTNNPFYEGNVIELSGDGDGASGAGFTRFLKITGTRINAGNLQVDVNVPNGTFANNENLSNLTLKVMFNVDDPANATTRPAEKTSETYSYEITEVEYVLRTIEMPPPYLNALQKRIQGEGMVIDVPTYTMYLDNIVANIRKQSLLVPCYSSRVKGVLSIPVNSNQTNYEYNRNGQVDNLKEYQAKIGSRVEPQRPVDLTNWTGNNTIQYTSVEHINELTNTLIATGIGERSLLKWRDNFVLGRSLSILGGSEDLSDKGFRWEVDYSQNPSAKNVYNYVNMVRRIQIVPTGIMIYG